MRVGNNSTTTPTLNNTTSPVNNTLRGGKLRDTELQHRWDKGDTALQRDIENLPDIKSELPDRIRRLEATTTTLSNQRILDDLKTF